MFIMIVLAHLILFSVIGWTYYDSNKFLKEQEEAGNFSHIRPSRERKLMRGRTTY